MTPPLPYAANTPMQLCCLHYSPTIQNFFQLHGRTTFPPVSWPGSMLFSRQQPSSPIFRMTPLSFKTYSQGAQHSSHPSTHDSAWYFYDACFPVLPTDYKLHKGQCLLCLVTTVYSPPGASHALGKYHLTEE